MVYFELAEYIAWDYHCERYNYREQCRSYLFAYWDYYGIRCQYHTPQTDLVAFAV